MHSKMSKRFFLFLIVVLNLFLSLPVAQAVDVPILTWERSKVQNIVVGNAEQQGNWTIKLLSVRNLAITFSPSNVNSRGFIVYSGELPSDLPLGEYSVFVFGDGSLSGTQIALVRVIALKRFSILDSTHEAGTLGICLTFLLVFLTTMKAKKYALIGFFHEDKLNEDGTLLYAKSIPRFVYRYYLYRANSLKSFKPSLMKFLLEFDDSFLHKLSPLAWVVLPTVGLISGIQGGFATGDQTLKFPLYSLALLTIISMIDSYSAIFAISGFVIAQIILGEVMNLRAVLVLAALGIAWAGTSLLSSHLRLLLEQEFRHDSRFSKSIPKKISMVIIASLSSSVFFFLLFLLAQSLSNNSVMNRRDVLLVAAFAGIISVSKFFIHHAQNSRIFRSESMSSNKDNSYKVDQIFTPFGTILTILATFFGAFVWTENWSISLAFALLNVIYFGLLGLQFSFHSFRYILKWERSIVVEPISLALLSYCVFLYIDKLPLQTNDRSIIFIFCVYIIAIIHNVASNVLEISQNSKVSST